ncbi:SPOR domain-containing protein [Desulfococcaceae bacterium HSG8]|nr:SPOR domain-containing protein [Desulfococcaceae bacterium HSG8]
MRKNGKNFSLKKEKSSFLSFFKRFAKWWLLFFYSAWVFVLGILVGRETSPVKFDTRKLQKELTILRETVTKEEQRRLELEREFLLYDRSQDFAFYDKLKTSEADRISPRADAKSEPPENGDREPYKPLGEEKSENNDRNAPRPEKTAKIKKSPQEEKIRIPEAAPKIKKKSPQEEKIRIPEPTRKAEKKEKPKAARTERASKSAAPERDITIQVASFRKSEDADRMKARLKKKGYAAYVASGEIPGKGVFYRVRVGYFRTRAEGRITRNRLKREKFKTFFINRHN